MAKKTKRIKSKARAKSKATGRKDSEASKVGFGTIKQVKTTFLNQKIDVYADTTDPYGC